ncbi:MAG TPA: IclR family transcriptional regulator [Sulfurospirillum arcachonense]|nr:IclR family transcriptional regulator [Sulfurospirillum arcachonense]
MNQSKSLTKGLSILKVIMQSDKPLTANFLCKKLDIDKSTMSRLITALIKEGFIEYITNSKEIILSDLMRSLTKEESRDKIVEKTRKILDECFYITQEASYVGVLDNTSVLYLNQVDKSNRVIKTRDSIGNHAPLHTNGFGKVLLSFGDVDISKINLKKYTSNTITSQTRLQKEIDIIRTRGYAIGNEEHEFGLKSIAVPYFNSHNDFIGAIGISGLSVRLDELTCHQIGQKIFKLLN